MKRDGTWRFDVGFCLFICLYFSWGWGKVEMELANPKRNWHKGRFEDYSQEKEEKTVAKALHGPRFPLPHYIN